MTNLIEEAATTLYNISDNSLSQLNELTLQEFLDTHKSKDTYNLLGLKGGKQLLQMDIHHLLDL